MNQPVYHRSRQVVLYVAVGCRNALQLMRHLESDVTQNVWRVREVGVSPLSSHFDKVAPSFCRGNCMIANTVSTTGQPCFVSLKLSFLCREGSLESVFGILTRPYRLDDLCLEYRQRKRYFSLLPNSQTSCGPHSTSYSIGTRGFPEVKMAGAWSDHSPPSRACMPSRRGKGQFWLLCAMNEWIGFTVRLRKEEPWVGRSLLPRYVKIAVAE
jgi:hypothetical protein